jgi:hypothetical protein
MPLENQISASKKTLNIPSLRGTKQSVLLGNQHDEIAALRSQ